jgi:hypothetical protein
MSLEREAGSDFVVDGEMKTIMKLEDLNTIDQLKKLPVRHSVSGLFGHQ